MVDVHDRYLENSEIVCKIANKFGFRLSAFDPNWTLSKKLTKIPTNQKEKELDAIININLEKFRISDEFMGRLAIFLGYSWIFEYSNEELEKQLEYTGYHINEINKFKLDDTYKNSYIKNIAEIESEINIRKELKGD